MSEPVEELLIKISADTAGLVASMTRTGQVIDQLAGKMGDTAKDHIAGGFFKAELAVHAFEKALEFLKEQTIDIVKEQYQHIDALTVMSNRTGIATESLVAMQEAGEHVHVSIEDIDIGLKRLQISMSAAADATSDARTTLEFLGLDFKELKRLKPEDQMVEIAKAISQIKDPADKTAAAVEFFGRSGAKVVEAMKDGLEEAKEETEKLGLAFSNLEGEQIRKANRALNDMHHIWEGIGRQLSIESAPFVVALGRGIKELVGTTGGFKDNIKDAFQAVVTGTAYASDALVGFQIMWDGIKLAVAELGNVFYQVANAMTQVSTAITKTILDVFVAMLEGIGKGFSWMMNKLADGLEYINKSAADSLHSFADSAGAVIGSVATDATKAIDDAAAGISETSQGLADEASARVEEAQADFDASLNQPIHHEAIIEWGDKVIATADEVAKTVKMTLGEAFNLLDMGSGEEKGGGDKGSLAGAKDRKAKLADLKKELEEETNIEVFAYWERMALIKEALDAKELDAEQANALREAEEKRHQLTMANLAIKNMDKIQTAEQLRRKNAVIGTKQMFGDLSTLMNSHSRAAFEVGKAAAIANATISGIEAAVHAWKWGMQTGGPYVAAAFTAASVAATAVQISQIASQSFGGGGGGASGFSGGVPAVTTAPQPGSGQNGGASGKTVSIFLQGDGRYDRKQIEDMIKGINDAVGDGVVLRAS